MTRPLPSPRLRAAGRCRRAAWALAPALLLSPQGAHAAALDQYTVQVLAQSGVQTPGFNPIDNYFGISQMNDHGQISLVTRTKESNGHQVLGVLSNGQFTPIAAGGGPSPDGKTWPTNTSFSFGGFADMNESGNVAFVPFDGAGNSLGVYFWDATKQAVNRLATPETPATGDLAFASGGKDGGAALNNRDEVAFVAPVKAASGSASEGVFLRRADGHIEPVALPGDALPGQGGQFRSGPVGARPPVLPILGLNDAGQVIFLALGTGIKPTGVLADSVYRWENGTISLVADSGTDIPGMGTSVGFVAPGPNNQNDEVLLNPWIPSTGGIGGFVLWEQGQLVPVLLPGQTLPGGGQFKAGGIPDYNRPNALGQYPFAVNFTENGTIGSGAYLVGADGKLSLIARTGMTTPLGTLTRVSPVLTSSVGSGGLGINRQGQVALTARIDNGPVVLLLLTPKNPAGSTAP